MRPLLLLLLASVALHAADPAPVPVAPPKLYSIRLTTGPAWDATKPPNAQPGMAEHSANIARLRREGTLVLGARFGELGLLVLRVPDEPAARAALAPDPTIAAGVFKTQIDVFAPFAHGTTAYLTSPEAIVLRAYLDAFNRHDPDAVAALCADDVKLFSIDGDKLSPDTTGRPALRDYLAGYFKNNPDVRSEFLSLEQTGPHLAVRERASWTAKDGTPRTLQSHGIYEIRDSRILRAWYFPSTR